MSRQILAIDIRNAHVAAVLYHTGLKNSSIAACAHVPIAPAAESDNGDSNRPLLVALKAIAGQIDSVSANVVVSLPADQVIFRSLTVPFKEDNKIRQILPFELEPILPVKVDQLTIDFQQSPMGDQSRIFAVAIDNTLLQDQLACFDDANLRPQLVVPGGFPLALQISVLDPQVTGHTLILNIGRTKTTLFALASGQIELVRTIPSDLSTKAGAESLALRVRQTLTALGDRHSAGFSPSAAYITGPGLTDEGRIPRLSKALDLPVGTIDLRRLLPKVDMDNQVQWNPHYFNDALALAHMDAEGGKCPNFHRISSPLRNFWTAYRPYILGPAVLLSAVLLLGLGSVLVDSYYLKKQVVMQNAQLVDIFKSAFPESRLNAPPLDQMKSKLKEAQKGNLAPQQTGAPFRTVDILLEVSQRIPQTVDVVFNRMTVGGGAVTISGETADFNTVDGIKSRIEKSSFFKQVTIASANMDKSGQKVRFKLKIDL